MNFQRPLYLVEGVVSILVATEQVLKLLPEVIRGRVVVFKQVQILGQV